MSEYIRKWSAAEHIRQRVVLLVKRVFRCGQYLLEWLPYRENWICCVTLTRKGYTDNMMYIAKALAEQTPSLEIIWVTKYPETCASAEKDGVRVAAHRTLKHFYLQFTSRIVLSDDALYYGFIKRKKQIYLNVWHGGINYKCLGMEGMQFEDAFMEKLFCLRNPSPDYMVAGCRFFAENMKQAFGFHNTVFLKSGLPRNDVLFHVEAFRGKMKKRCGIGDKKVILYAPTFREQKEPFIMDGIDFGKLTEAAHDRYGGEWVALYRAHYFEQGPGHDGKNVIDVSDYEDMQEILIDTDILISDYSSCMWDFSFLHRPIVIYAPDEKRYCELERGFTAAGKRMPYPKARDMKELLAMIEQHDFDRDAEAIEAHHREMGAYDRGNATRDIVDFVLSKMQEAKR